MLKQTDNTTNPVVRTPSNFTDTNALISYHTDKARQMRAEYLYRQGRRLLSELNRQLDIAVRVRQLRGTGFQFLPRHLKPAS